MGSKYMLYAFNYPHKGYNDASYQTNNFILFIITFIFWKFKYFGVDAIIRNV
jgi:hypothetical protein